MLLLRPPAPTCCAGGSITLLRRPAPAPTCCAGGSITLLRRPAPAPTCCAGGSTTLPRRPAPAPTCCVGGSITLLRRPAPAPTCCGFCCCCGSGGGGGSVLQLPWLSAPCTCGCGSCPGLAWVGRGCSVAEAAGNSDAPFSSWQRRLVAGWRTVVGVEGWGWGAPAWPACCCCKGCG